MNRSKISQTLLFIQPLSCYGLFESHCVNAGIFSPSGTRDMSYKSELKQFQILRKLLWNFCVVLVSGVEGANYITEVSGTLFAAGWGVTCANLKRSVLLKLHSCYSNCLELAEQKVFFWEAHSHHWQCVALPAHGDNKKQTALVLLLFSHSLQTRHPLFPALALPLARHCCRALSQSPAAS